MPHDTSKIMAPGDDVLVPLTQSENERLVRVEDRAPMGRLLSESYWLPATLSQCLVSDGAPRRVKLLGQNLVAFRSTDGRIGIFDEACPHRRVSLALARNEDNALTCIFHGWKFGVDGVVKDAPTQSADRAAFCRKVPLRHYPAREAGGLVWVFLGPANPPPFPRFPFTDLPAEQVCSAVLTLQYNWVQNLDGLADSSHIGIMHKEYMASYSASPLVAAATRDTAPKFEFQETQGGFRFAAIREASAGQRYARVSEFVAPFYMFIAFAHGYVNISVPADDQTTTQFIVQYSTTAGTRFEPQPLDDLAARPPYPAAGPDRTWGQNREAMTGRSFSGFGIHEADFVVAESQGSITDRSAEYLGDGDLALMRLRRLLLGAVTEFEAGRKPKIACQEETSFRDVSAGEALLSIGENWLRTI